MELSTKVAIALVGIGTLFVSGCSEGPPVDDVSASPVPSIELESAPIASPSDGGELSFGESTSATVDGIDVVISLTEINPGRRGDFDVLEPSSSERLQQFSPYYLEFVVKSESGDVESLDIRDYVTPLLIDHNQAQTLIVEDGLFPACPSLPLKASVDESSGQRFCVVGLARPGDSIVSAKLKTDDSEVVWKSAP